MTTMSKTSGLSERLRGTNQPIFSGDSERTLTNAAETWFTAVTECQREMIGFVSMRLEKDSETAREMIGCKNAADATKIQSRWIEETLRDYSSEMTKLMGICTKAVKDKGMRSET
jgi:Phasin protein